MSVLELINNEKIENKSILPSIKVMVAPMNDSQKQVLSEVEKNTITTVIGCAGSGKSSVITALASDFIIKGKKVLIVSKSDHAVDVITNKLNSLGCGQIALRGGKQNSQTMLASYIMDLLENKIDLTLSNNEKSNFIRYIFNKNISEAKKLLKTKRINALNELLSSIDNRKNLLTQAKACLVKRKNQRDKVLKTIDFMPILEAMPCICITSYEISNLIPLQKELFDIVIVDESSEMDIASFIPCAYRAKKACIVGDNKQLKSLLFMDKKKNKSFMTKNDVSADLELIWDYKENSLFDFAQYYSEKCILLNEQYRMPENVFKFNNDTFYNGMIKSAKKAEINALKKVFINGQTDINKTYNFAECEAILKELKRILKENKDNNKTIGILSMFKAQVELISKAIWECVPYDEIDKHNITVTTANGAQGAEWDYVLISWAIDNDCKHQSLTFACNPERLNVITSRAREQVINFYSKDNFNSDCLLARYLNSIK